MAGLDALSGSSDSAVGNVDKEIVLVIEGAELTDAEAEADTDDGSREDEDDVCAVTDIAAESKPNSRSVDTDRLEDLDLPRCRINPSFKMRLNRIAVLPRGR